MSQVILVFLFLFVLLPLGYAGFVFAPWVPTRKKDTKRIIELVKKYLPNDSGVIYELGSGTGIITFALAQQIEKKVIGIELVLPLYLYAKIKGLFLRLKVKFLWKNFFNQDLSDASLIYLFGTPKPLAGKLKEKLERECKEGTIIISYVFSFSGWEPVEIHKPSKEDLSVFVYKIKTARNH